MITLDYTISEIYRLAAQYKDDTAKYNLRTVEEIFEFTKNIPYRTDLNSCDALECLKRPMYGVVEGDCDDKVIFAGAALTRIGIPWRVVTVSYRIDKKIHHVYIEVFIHGRWLPFDATYQINKLFYEKPFTEKIIWSNPMKNYNDVYIPLGDYDYGEALKDLGETVKETEKVWENVKTITGGGGKVVDVYPPYEKCHAAAIALKEQIIKIYVNMDKDGKALMSLWSNNFFNSTLSILQRESASTTKGVNKLVEEQVADGKARGWWNDEQSRIAWQCSYPLEAILVKMPDRWSATAAPDWFIKPLNSGVIIPCQDYLTRKAAGSSGFLSTPIIPGVDNLLLLAGAGAALFFFTRKKGRR